MCGRYALYGPKSRLRAQFDLDFDELGEDSLARYNAGPLLLLPVIRQAPDGRRAAHLLRWGLIPPWAKDASIGTKLINARGETVAQMPSFRAAYKSRRCIVPVNGFYEWKAIPGGKQPYFIHPTRTEFFGLAGLWERWSQPDGTVLDTFTVVTTDASEGLKSLHPRMPVILQPEDYGLWLDKGTHPELLRQLIVPCPEDALALHPVSRAVGNVRNEGPQLIEPLAAEPMKDPPQPGESR